VIKMSGLILCLAVGVFLIVSAKLMEILFPPSDNNKKIDDSDDKWFSDDDFASFHDHNSHSCVDIDNDNDIGLINK